MSAADGTAASNKEYVNTGPNKREHICKLENVICSLDETKRL